MSKKVISIDEGAGKTGAFVSESGVYGVLHEAHRLPREVTLLRGQQFPRCQACEEPVTFRLRRRLTGADTQRFGIQLHQLPVLDRYGRAS